jgi:hypothetical protein
VRYPGPDDLRELHGRSPSWYAAWLRIGLAAIQFERKGSDAFPGAENFVDQHDGPVASELRLVAFALPERDLEAFRQGLAELLQSLNFADPREAAVARSVMQLGAGIAARGLLGILASKSFTLAGDHGTRLYDLAFDLAAHLPDLQPDDTIRCLRHLVKQSALFQPATVGRALIAMTQAKADAFSDHFKFLRPALEDQYRYLLREDEKEQERKRARLRKRLINGLTPLFRDMSPLTRSDPANPLPLWWLDALAEHAPEAFDEKATFAAGDEDRTQGRVPQQQPAHSYRALFAQACAAIESALLINWQGTSEGSADPEEETGFDPEQSGAAELAMGVGDLGDTEMNRPSDFISAEEPEDVCG